MLRYNHRYLHIVSLFMYSVDKKKLPRTTAKTKADISEHTCNSHNVFLDVPGNTSHQLSQRKTYFP